MSYAVSKNFDDLYTPREIQQPPRGVLQRISDELLRVDRTLANLMQQIQSPPPPEHFLFRDLPSSNVLAPVLPIATTVDELPMTFDSLYAPARQEEQHAHFTAGAGAMESRKTAHGLSSLADAAASISIDTITEEKLNRQYRLLCRLGALDPSFPQEMLFQRAETAAAVARPIASICASLGITLTPASHRLIVAFNEQEAKNAPLENPSSLAIEKEHLTAALATLEQLLTSPPEETEELEDRNRNVLLTLRAIYSSPLYNALCMSDIPLIDILDSIAIGQYTNTSLAQTFEKLGQKLDESQRPLPERIDAIWNGLEKIGVDNGIFSTLLHYSFCLLVKIGLPYLALKIAQIFSLNRLIPHIGDERSILGNTPGALTDEIQTNDSLYRRTIRTVVLSAPTLGYDIAPEFRAALQALENNQFSRSDNPFLTWAYTNLQNISSTPEHPSTIALMELRNLYPLSFQAITLPQNLPASSTSTFSDDDVLYHLSQLFQEQTSSLENRGTGSDAGYSAPLHFLTTYRPAIEAVANDAYRIIDSNRGDHTPSALNSPYAARN